MTRPVKHIDAQRDAVLAPVESRVPAPVTDVPTLRDVRPLVVAVAGQPNTGKSTIFNKLTGLRQRVGNWPGKTVDRKEGVVRRGDRSYLFVDLPGTYGLTANSLEEEVARDYILSGAPDVILTVVNAASLERSMYLVAELLLLDIPVVIALNMMDVAAQEGRSIDPQALADATGLSVVPLIGTKSRNMDGLLDVLDDVEPIQPRRRSMPAAPEAVNRLARWFEGVEALADWPQPKRWIASKLFEQDHGLESRIKDALAAGEWETLHSALAETPDTAMGIYAGRQKWIDVVCKDAVQTDPRGMGPTDKWDRVLLHSFWGRVIAFLVIPLGCLLGVTLGMLTGGMALMAALSAGPAIKTAWPGMAGSLVASALVPALGWVVALVFIIGFIYAIFHFLEDTGYLARISYLMDPMLSRMGIDGKSAIPLLMGLLCNTVAIAGSRVVDTRRRRLITLVMLPFLPCSGQTGVAFLFAFALFPPASAILVILGISLANIFLACLAARIMNGRLPSRQGAGLIMELPLYHKPNLKTILMGVRTRVEIFLRNASGYITAALILVWGASYFPHGEIESSYLYMFGRWLEPVGALVGFDWRFVVALLSSFVAKEITAGTLAVLFSVSASDHQAIVQAIRSAITPQGALAFVVASNLFLPCIATISALRLELGAWRSTAALVATMLATAFLAAFITYHTAMFLS
ncbi:MAG: ferrous iron transport protein B [Desulfocurvibacter africanus]